MVNPVEALTQAVDVTIASGQSVTATINLGGRVLTGIHMPATWTAANITLRASYDGTTFNDIYDAAGTEITITAAAARYIALDPTLYLGVRFLVIRSGTSGTPVNQGGERVLYLELAEPDT